MTPQEKSEQLVTRYLLATPIGFHIEDAKKCAIIAQKNLIQKLKELNIEDSFEEQVLFEINVL